MSEDHLIELNSLDDDKSEVNDGIKDDESVSEAPTEIITENHDNHNKLEEDKLRRKHDRQELFLRDHRRFIDYVLVYEDNEDIEKQRKREVFEENIDKAGLDLEVEDKSHSADGKTYYLKLHATWDAIATVAELLSIRKRICLQKEDEESICTCPSPFDTPKNIVAVEEDFFTAPFNRQHPHIFSFGGSDEEHQEFFTRGERSLIVKYILDKTQYTLPDASEVKYGIERLIQAGVYKAAYPLHEGSYSALSDEPSSPEEKSKDRARLYESWAKPRRCFTKQPLDLIRKYYGEKVAIYFSWLGFYTAVLIPAALAGIAVFIYGLVTMSSDIPTNDICDKLSVGNLTMCPACDQRCSYLKLYNSCVTARFTYVFDNYGTVAFAIFMSCWAAVFLEFWKRRQFSLQYDWDVEDYQLDEPMRPEFQFKVTTRKINPVTQEEEPYVSQASKCIRIGTSLSVVLLLVALVVAAIFGVIVYRIVVIALLYSQDEINQYSGILTTLTAAVINLIIIMLLNLVYRWIAKKLTDLEVHRLESSYENNLTIKLFLFQFVNFYGAIFYIAFFKGSFVDRPGTNRQYIFGKYRQDECDPAGCMVDLFIQLALIMIGKQALNSIKELAVPLFLTCIRKRKSGKETSENLYMSWEQDYDLQPFQGLYDEYLEMVIQFGFTTLFVTVFPLAPLFALLNNVIEIRLDAYKLVCLTRRPPLQKAKDIGIWENILSAVAHIAIVTNAFIVAWTTEFVPRMVYLFAYSDDRSLRGYTNNSLSVFNASSFTDQFKPDDPQTDVFGVVTECRYKDYRYPPGDPDEYGYTQMYWNVFCARLAFVIVFEHICLILVSLVSYVIPDRPASVNRMRAYESQLVKKLMFDHSFTKLCERRSHSKQD